MIDRKTAAICAILIALMLGAVVARVLLGDGPMPAPLLRQLILLPMLPALLVFGLYAIGRRAVAAEANMRAWNDWGNQLAIGACACVLLTQVLAILRSIGLQTPAWIAYASPLATAIIFLFALNQMPKLPWFERNFRPGGELGPIYGPRYLRTASKISVAYWVVMQVCIFALPNQIPLFLVLATALFLVCNKALQRYFHRRWVIEQSMHSG